MDLSRFRRKYKGRYISGYTTGGRQCIDLARKWIENVHGNAYKGLPSVPAAKDMFAAARTRYYKKVRFVPGRVPPAGALVIFGGTRWGHVSIATANSTKRTLRTFDQNWPVGAPCKNVNHPARESGAYKVIGWLIPRPWNS